MTTPRAIEPTHIRLDDTVRAEANTTAVEGKVTSLIGFRIGIGNLLDLPMGIWSWTLLDRPEPPREVGSRWREDKAGGGEYILDAEGDYVWYRGRRVSTYCLTLEHDADIIARLVPLDGTR